MPMSDVIWSQVARIWWLIVWRTTLGSLLVGFAGGFLVGVLGYVVGMDKTKIGAAGSILGVLASFVVVRMALIKNYRDFHLGVVPD